MVPGLLVGHRPLVMYEECWGDRNGEECGDPATINGLCGDCYARVTGERPALILQPTPPSPAFVTGSGRR